MSELTTSTISTETKFFINTNSVFHFELFLNINENHKPNVGDVVTSNVKIVSWLAAPWHLLPPATQDKPKMKKEN